MASSPRRAKRPPFPWLLVALFAFIVGTLWWLGTKPQAPVPSSAPGRRQAAVKAPAHSVATPRGPRDEMPPTRDERPLPPTRWQPQRPLLPSGHGRVAIIVDDVGYSSAALEGFTALGSPLTFSVLPGVEGSRELARECAASGFEVMLHLPMEPLNPQLDPGPGCIMTDMTDEQIVAAVEKALAEVPQAVGVNNHMGSRATADVRVMRTVLSVVQDHGLFFVDSRTSDQSIVQTVAAELRLPCAARSVFLDANFSPAPGSTYEFFDSAQQRVRELGRLAQYRGSAMGICHYRQQTAQMLAHLLPALKEAGIEVVSASELVADSR